MDQLQKTLAASRQSAIELQNSLADRDKATSDAQAALQKQYALVQDLQTRVKDGDNLMKQLAGSLEGSRTTLASLKTQVDDQTRALSDMFAL